MDGTVLAAHTLRNNEAFHIWMGHVTNEWAIKIVRALLPKEPYKFTFLRVHVKCVPPCTDDNESAAVRVFHTRGSWLTFIFIHYMCMPNTYTDDSKDERVAVMSFLTHGINNAEAAFWSYTYKHEPTAKWHAAVGSHLYVYTWFVSPHTLITANDAKAAVMML